MSNPKIGVVGVGRMGANIARRLKDVGYSVVAVYDVRPEAAAEVSRGGFRRDPRPVRGGPLLHA